MFKVGSKVIYPGLGVAEITGRESRTVDGEELACLVLSVPERGWGTSGALKVSVPEGRAEDLGVRHAISEEDAADVLDMLAVAEVRMPANWSRRFKNHQEKLRSGDVFDCAEVVRNLAFRDRDGRLSAAEQAMYARARLLLVSELAVSWSVDDEAAGARVDEALGFNAAEGVPAAGA